MQLATGRLTLPSLCDREIEDNKHVKYGTYSWMNTISARGDARRNLTKSISIFNRPSTTYTQGAILIVSSTGDLLSKNLTNSISCGTPDISVIFTSLSFLNVHFERLCFSQRSKSGASSATRAFEDPYLSEQFEKQND
ncbi:hypothetical protein TorRG33x02_322500 [Trema orientale]|uniref:Uncharacterized protein n=1 Tax=Trema orientale TaxID=63057 RepID=A0A2P5BFW5_TREOI|nr:hypothetical protein TorRG33x02_322500 [Trema orientale]